MVAIAKGVTTAPQGLPERTLGWTILAWCHRWLRIPDGIHAGDPWMFTAEQARFLLWWYAIDGAGRFIYRSGMFRRMKGHGKDPMAAALCAIEFVGPCRWLGDSASGEPIAIPVYASWVQTAAVSREQTQNTMTLFPAMLSDELIAEHGIDLGIEKIRAHNGRCRIEAVTSSPKSLEGNRSTFVLKNETHHWLSSNEGLEMSKVIRRNTAKSDSRVLAISNAHQPGEDSDAEKDYDTYEAIRSGRSRARGFLYDSLEAPPEIDLYDEDSLREGIRLAAGDSWWVPVDRLVEEALDPRQSPADTRRFYLNQIVAAEDAWVSRQEWDVLALEGYEPAPGSIITLGFDGSKTDDHTALVGYEVETDFLFPLGVWDPDDYGGEVPRQLVDGMVRQAFETYDVVGFYSDVHPWESYIDSWADELSSKLCVRATATNPIGWDMRGRGRDATHMIEAMFEAIVERRLSHSGDRELAMHVYNARRAPNQWGVSIRKETRESPRKIDGAVAGALARQCARDYLALPPNRRRRKRTGRASF